MNCFYREKQNEQNKKTMGNETSKSRSKKQQQQIQQEQKSSTTTNNRKKKFSSSISSSLSHDSSSNSSSFSKDDRLTNQNESQTKPTNQNEAAQFPSTNRNESLTKSTNQNNGSARELTRDFEDTTINLDRKEKRRFSTGSKPKRSLDQTERRTRFKDLRYQSMRGTSSDPKIKQNIIKSATPSNNSSFDHQSNTSTINKEKNYEKSKSKRGKRINTIKFLQCELWDPFEVGDRTSLNFTLHPYFSVKDKPGELTCHTLALNFLRVPDEKLEKRLQLYDFEIIFTETKLAVKAQQQPEQHLPPTTTHKLIRAHTFYGSSNSVKVNERSALIEGNFYNPEYGKMDFFQFELKLVPVQFRELDRPTELDYINNIYNHENSNNNNNNNTTTTNNNADIGNTNNSNPNSSVKTMTVNELFGTVARLIKPVTKRSLSNQSISGVRETWWGSFIMKVRGSYKSKEYTFQVYERHEMPTSAENLLVNEKEDDVNKESCLL